MVLTGSQFLQTPSATDAVRTQHARTHTHARTMYIDLNESESSDDEYDTNNDLGFASRHNRTMGWATTTL